MAAVRSFDRLARLLSMARSVWNTFATDREPFEALGERIVQAARLAVGVHLFESLKTVDAYGQQVVIGGAGPRTRASDEDDRVFARANVRNKATDGERT